MEKPIQFVPEREHRKEARLIVSVQFSLGPVVAPFSAIRPARQSFTFSRPEFFVAKRCLSSSVNNGAISLLKSIMTFCIHLFTNYQ